MTRKPAILNVLDPNTIAYVNALKEETATKVYGEKAKYGALVIVTDAFLEPQKEQLKQQGIEGKISRISHHTNGEIKSIKISLRKAERQESTASWENSKAPITDIGMGKTNDNTLFVRALPE